ncbi:hypothetical protein D3C75_1090590 [compost metagenome]
MHTRLILYRPGLCRPLQQARLQQLVALGIAMARVEMDHIDIVERCAGCKTMQPVPHQITHEARTQAPIVQPEPPGGA